MHNENAHVLKWGRPGTKNIIHVHICTQPYLGIGMHHHTILQHCRANWHTIGILHVHVHNVNYSNPIHLLCYHILCIYLVHFLWCSLQGYRCAPSDKPSCTILQFCRGSLGMNISTAHAVYVTLSSRFSIYLARKTCSSLAYTTQ